MINFKQLIWAEKDQVENIPHDVKMWLYDEQSLTKKLKTKFELFSVNVSSQRQVVLPSDEESFLMQGRPCLEREVELIGDGNAVVYARSVIPKTVDTEGLLNIGVRPLGEMLFNSSSVTRDAFQIANANGTWGRRSIFTLGNTKILVSEFFLDSLFL
ncbi:Chorismate--pyruvate lyase [Bathymodiolus heckerae thiotrophic gill symbiont]|uniref:chorismate--pyruvate lyase family protein n=1 Tax=Bathymodiolus heckerae thiotrophic gill symbiont TaxID=1052212 RepID=UPI0010B74D53|nr:chorismate lyase [Bathymodiolus heckerae thiotrophic gill symbiont]CAC9588154.1 Chorismate--pyruvate lyase (EC 4.1.3.40) [uncultured Gammaproteobacteria bacterium]SHN91673.1 Chorismate--pyruvate lyase [Bathymodiolus heckerae thiotrophic gill symbiont]